MSKSSKKLTSILPKLTGVYFFKNAQHEIIYIGKAKNLYNRVNSYFQKYASDWKIQHLIDEHESVDFILTTNEIESLLLEAQLIQKYKPKFNALLKEGQPFVYILFAQPSPKKGHHNLPTVEIVRNRKKKGIYFGPFLQKIAARKTYAFIMNTFQLNICNKKIDNGCLDYHIGNCAGSCKKDFDSADYCFRIQLACDALKNNRDEFIKKIKTHIAAYNAELAFEKSQRLHDYLNNVDLIFSTLNTQFSETKFTDDIFIASTPTPYSENIDNSVNTELQHLLKFPTPIKTIDCFDISHFQSSHLVGSCVRFSDGKPEKHMFRHFKIKTLETQNDYAALQEIVQRRYKDKTYYPDLIVIDGGKGQLSAVKHVLHDAPIVSLAKKEETLFSTQFPEGIRIDVKTKSGKLLIELRDYAHHFAINYHRLRRKKNLLK